VNARQYVCRYGCGYSTDFTRQMDVHLSKTHADNTWSCPRCGMEFPDREARSRHAKYCNTTAPHGQSVGPMKGSAVTAEVKEMYPGEQQEWTEYLGEMKDAIERGLCDEILKQIARAVFDRRDIINGKEPGTSFKGRPKSAIKDANDLDVAAKDPANALAGGDVFTGKVPQVDGTKHDSIVNINGKEYYKHDIVGLVIRIPNNLNPKYVRGLRVRVTGVGTQRAKVEWVDLPPEGSRFRQTADDMRPTFLPLSTLNSVLG
jgi:hypothetical protein